MQKYVCEVPNRVGGTIIIAMRLALAALALHSAAAVPYLASERVHRSEVFGVQRYLEPWMEFYCPMLALKGFVPDYCAPLASPVPPSPSLPPLHSPPDYPVSKCDENGCTPPAPCDAVCN